MSKSHEIQKFNKQKKQIEIFTEKNVKLIQNYKKIENQNEASFERKKSTKLQNVTFHEKNSIKEINETENIDLKTEIRDFFKNSLYENADVGFLTTLFRVICKIDSIKTLSIADFGKIENLKQSILQLEKPELFAIFDFILSCFSKFSEGNLTQNMLLESEKNNKTFPKVFYCFISMLI